MLAVVYVFTDYLPTLVAPCVLPDLKFFFFLKSFLSYLGNHLSGFGSGPGFLGSNDFGNLFLFFFILFLNFIVASTVGANVATLSCFATEI